jgi:two-component system CheB/CheR fusion protein
MLLRHLQPEMGHAVVITGSDEVASHAWCTRLSLVRTSQDVTLQAGHAYLVPPEAVATVDGERLHLQPRSEVRAPHRPIDRLFRSMAQTGGSLARGVLLSGISGDGTSGSREIRRAGGITFSTVRTLDPSEGDLAVDLVLSPQEIASSLEQLVHLESASWSAEELERLTGLFFVLQEATGVDFSRVRISSTLRRVRRRMALAGERELGAYVNRLSQDRQELDRLYRDLCRRSTRFFRDARIIEHLRTTLFTSRLSERFAEPVRLWVVGCGTGEEAYSLALALAEVAAELEVDVPVKLLATDLDDSALDRARAGIFPDEIQLDVPPELLHKYFVPTVDGRFRIHPRLREMCTFSRHDPLSDPPFSNLDLVWCHGYFEHLDPVSIKCLLPRLHFAMKSEGRAVFGPGEPDGLERLFEPAETEGLYARRPATVGRWLEPHSQPPAHAAARYLDLERLTDGALLDKFAPPAVVMDTDWDILLFRGPVAPYISPRPGEARLNLEHIVHPDLLPEIRRLLALETEGKPVRGVPVPVRRPRATGLVQVGVMPLDVQGGRVWLVTFEESVGQLDPATQGDDPWAERAARLGRELEEVRKSASARLLAREEEVASLREELVSVSEEGQSSQEELAHVRLELDQIRQELRQRELALNSVSAELHGLLGGLGLPLVTVDTELRIMRATGSARELFRARASDLGSPLVQLRFPCALDLQDALHDVIRTGDPACHSVVEPGGREWGLSMRCLRDPQGTIWGAAVLAVDLEPLRQGRALPASTMEET